MSENKTLYLIDGSAYVYRAYHAIRSSLMNSKGLPTNAVFGFTKMLVKLIQDKSPEYIGVLFDMKGPTFRHEIYEDYKANRPPMPEDIVIQLPYIKKITKGFNIQLMELEGYEADDLIGTLAHQGEAQGFSVILVTSDKDFLQLVTDKITIWDPMKDKSTDLTNIRENLGIEPHQMIDVMGLWGDKSDNIPGVPGIGEKTALSLIKTFGSIDVLYDKVDTIKKKKQHENLVNYKKQAFLSKELVTIKTDVPVNFNAQEFKIQKPDKAVLGKLFQELEFRQLQKDFQTGADSDKKNYKAIYTMDELSDLIKNLKSAKIFALDTETTSTNPMKAKLVGLSFALNPDQGFYIPCGHDYLGAPKQLNLKNVLKTLKALLENPKFKKVGQNIKYDWIVLERHGIKLDGVMFDTMLASYLINPSKRAHNLDQIASDFLNHKTISYEEVAGKNKVGFNQILVDKAVPYACEDADITLMAFHVLQPQLKQMNLIQLMEKVEVPLIPVLKNMEMTGICVDKDKLYDLSLSFEHQIEQIEQEIYEKAGEIFNIKSSQQLGYILFEKLELPVKKKTKKKTGYSTDVEVLTSLAQEHELPDIILKHRSLSKLKSTYIDALLEMIHPETGRIHTSYNQSVTVTGRLSSSNPNLQNIPIRTDEGMEIRKTFIPKNGWFLVSADYSQIELRLLAHYSEDEILIRAFQEEEDIHTRTASEIFQIFPQMITSELRRQAKAINFGIIYGMGAFKLAKELSISRKMAQTYIDNYFSRYKGVKEFIEKTVETARKTQKTSTLLGRIRLLPEINNSNHNVRSFAERIAVNTPIQGSAADLIKLAMIEVDKQLQVKKFKAKMLLTVHDELVFEVPADELEIVKKLVKDIMENIWDLKVPLKVNVDWGINWAEAH